MSPGKEERRKLVQYSICSNINQFKTLKPANKNLTVLPLMEQVALIPQHDVIPDQLQGHWNSIRSLSRKTFLKTF